MDSFNDPVPGPLIRLSDIPTLPWLPPRRGKSLLAYPTIWRWAKHGAAGVLLKTVSVGSTPCTTEAWLREFFAKVAAARAGQPAPQQTRRQPAAREREIASARKRLDAVGI